MFRYRHSFICRDVHRRLVELVVTHVSRDRAIFTRSFGATLCVMRLFYPVVAVAMLSFALGLVFSLFLYVGQHLHRASRDRWDRRHRDIEERERKLSAAQESAQESAAPQAAAPAAPAAGEAPPSDGKPRKASALSRFLGIFR